MLPSVPMREPAVRGTSWDRNVVTSRISTSPSDAGPVSNERIPGARPIDFSELVDPRRGSVRASGHLTAQAADLLRGTVLALHGDGHSRVVVDLGDVEYADEAGLAVLESLRTTVADDGGRLLLLGDLARGER